MRNNEPKEPEEIEHRLAKLARATESVRPRADFTARVMAATANTTGGPRGGALVAREGFWEELPRIARRLVPVAALAAALGVAWGVTNDEVVDDALAGSYGATELEW